MNSRVFPLNKKKNHKGDSIVYWMDREHRIDDNWALIFAHQKAFFENIPIKIIFVLSSKLYGQQKRSISFMLEGLKETEKRANELGFSFNISCSENPAETIIDYSKAVNASALICDFNPLRENLHEQDLCAKSLDIPVYEVDSHNIVPSRYISNKQEYGAYTLRRKIEKILPHFLKPIPDIELLLEKEHIPESCRIENNWQKIETHLLLKGPIAKKNFDLPGYTSGMEKLDCFIYEKLKYYSSERNNPNVDAQSGLSFYLHFGQITANSAALAASIFLNDSNLKGGFLDEIIVRKELSDNFCLYNKDYDTFEGFPAWAKHSLIQHSLDKREYLYSFQVFEKAETHDRLWNAAQMQLIKTGRIHGYLRMYWAKKILEWSKNPLTAINIAVGLNDNYAIDGRDPNGYAGCAWAIGGLHDRGWAERDVFGKIRFMNEKGCRRKFDVDEYIDNWLK